MIWGAGWLGDWGGTFEIGGLWRQGGSGVSGDDLGGGHEVELETVDGREDGLAWFGAAVGVGSISAALSCSEFGGEARAPFPNSGW